MRLFVISALTLFLNSCSITENEVQYRALGGEHKMHLIETSNFSIKAPICFELSYTSLKNDDTRTGRLNCKDISIYFNYGDVYSFDNENVSMDVIEQHELDTAYSTIRVSKKSFPHKLQFYLENREKESPELDFISKTLFLSTEVDNLQDEEMVLDIFKSVYLK